MSPIVGEGWWWMKEVCHEGEGCLVEGGRW